MLATGIAHTSFCKMLQTLDEMETKFHLTGSQFFLGQGNDFDYFVKNDGVLKDKLSKLGFAEISKEHYGDSLCVVVMRWNYNGLYQIDIQLVSNAELKLKVQNKFLLLGNFNPSKEEWDLAFQLLS